MLSVLIRREMLLLTTHNMFLWRNKKNIYLIPPLVWSHEFGFGLLSIYFLPLFCMIQRVISNKTSFEFF